MRSWLVCLLLLLPLDALAGALSGTWALDREASDDNSAVMDAQGVPGWQQSIAKRMTIRTLIDDRGADLDLTFKASVFKETMNIVPDGKPREETTKRGIQQTVTHTREDDGSIKGEIVFKTKDGVPAVIKLHRWILPDGKTMVIDMTFTLGENEPKVFKRVFRREA